MSGEQSLSLAAWLTLALAGCGVTPLTNRINIGQEPFVIGVGEGSDGFSDLYAPHLFQS